MAISTVDPVKLFSERLIRTLLNAGINHRSLGCQRVSLEHLQVGDFEVIEIIRTHE